VILQAQALLNDGQEVPEVGRRLGILANTLHKAIRDGRLREGIKKKSQAASPRKPPQRVSGA
jgi:hypothetical protein